MSFRMKSVKWGVFLLLSIMGSSTAWSEKYADSIVNECTTNSSIYFTTNIPAQDGKTAEEKKDAILRALGISGLDDNLSPPQSKGEWYFESESADAIYAGLSIRSHYLKAAIINDDQGITTIVCDSMNLKQTSDSMHGKVPSWKGTLNTKIRMELNRTPRKINTATYIRRLESLHSKGFVTDKEFKVIKRRITSKKK